MKKNSNLWAQSSCNRLIEERIKKNTHAKHIHAVGSCRSVSDHHAPQDFPHLRNKVNTRAQQENRAADIQLENRHLLQKMLSIDTKPSQFSAASVGNRHAPRSMHGEAHRRELDRITVENQALLGRLQCAKSEFDLRGLEELEMDRQAVKHRICQNSLRGRQLKLPMPQKSYSVPCLPSLPGQAARFSEDDWVQLTNNELDKKLLELENNQGSKQDLT